jgi:hypothetical protein
VGVTSRSLSFANVQKGLAIHRKDRSLSFAIDRDLSDCLSNVSHDVT